jgi:isoquinoline 1-oxidoreductase beta subunit
VEANFDTYRMARMVETPPRIDVHLVPSGGPKWGGVGEPGLGEPALPPVLPALCNAIFAATGKRVRNLPIDTTQLAAT